MKHLNAQQFKMSNAQKSIAFLFPTVCKRSLHLELVLKNFSKNCAHTISNGYLPWNSAIWKDVSLLSAPVLYGTMETFQIKNSNFGNQSIWVEKGESGNI